MNGSAIYFLESTAQIQNSSFVSNHAKGSGGALYFNGTTTAEPEAIQYQNFVLLNNSYFISNQADRDGGALYCSNVSLSNAGIIVIMDGFSEFNMATNGGFAYLSKCQVKLLRSRFLSNTASHGGVFYARDSVLNFHSAPRVYNNVLMNNTAESKGGALFLYRSHLPVVEHFTLIENNAVTSANGMGGAIYIDDSDCQCIKKEENFCFFNTKNHQTCNTYLKFSNNKARYGSILYGGLLDRCLPSLAFPSNLKAIQVFKCLSNLESGTIPMAAVSSTPLKVCWCLNYSMPDCSLRQFNFTTMRGQSVRMRVSALDQNKNSVPSVITASYRETLFAQLKQGERSREIPDECTDLEYHIFTESLEKVTLLLEASENPCTQDSSSIMTVNIRVVPCIRGFEQHESTCVCDKRLTKYFNITVCNIDTRSIQRKGSIWLRYDEDYLKIHANCPLDYCQVTGTAISLSSPDDQCANNRSGILCGACQANYSVALGGSKCKDCTRNYTFIWLTLVIALAGLALVAFLLTCNITISTGTLNGLIFYANVVSTSGLMSLHNCSISPILSVFIAWVNLDLGVETCFYSGMDTYQKTWLQFVFPLYIWLLVGAIIVASYYSSTAMKLFGRNNIAILATLFLLSYSKLLKTIITALSFTQVWRGAADYSNASDQLVPYKVWTYDGNVEYLRRPHVILFVVAFLLLVLLFLPYTLLLFLGQCVRSVSAKRRFCRLQWIRSTAFISIMDAYHAPYNRRHRYWTGLMLLTRCVLFLVFATNSSIITNMFAIVLVVMGILLFKTQIRKVYKKYVIEIIELGFLLNLGILSAVLFFLKGIDSSNEVVCKTFVASTSVSFIMFLNIVLHHAYLRIKNTKYVVAMKHALLKRRPGVGQHGIVTADSQVLDSVHLNKKFPTTTTLELREQLLES